MTLSSEATWPESIDIKKADRKIMIRWSDGCVSTYTFEQLRWACPCAVCQGEGGVPGMLSQVDHLTEQQMTIADARLVGNYAIAFTWGDGHSTGIYSFDQLRRLGS